MDKLVFKTSKPRRKGGETPVVRLTREAYELLLDWEAATGLSIGNLASQMIIFAESRSVLDNNENEEV